jgi:hypothetical protein
MQHKEKIVLAGNKLDFTEGFKGLEHVVNVLAVATTVLLQVWFDLPA